MKGIISLMALLSTLFLVGCGDNAPEKELETP